MLQAWRREDARSNSAAVTHATIAESLRNQQTDAHANDERRDRSSFPLDELDEREANVDRRGRFSSQ